MDYLVIMRMRDPQNPERQRLRAELRPAHLERASKFREAGHVLLGGALLDDAGNPTAPPPSPASTAGRSSTPGSPATLDQGRDLHRFIPFRIAEHRRRRRRSGDRS